MVEVFEIQIFKNARHVVSYMEDIFENQFFCKTHLLIIEFRNVGLLNCTFLIKKQPLRTLAHAKLMIQIRIVFVLF